VKDKEKKPAPEPVIFGDAESVEEIARRLIPKYHSHLASAKIRYIFRSRSTKRGGLVVPGGVAKFSKKYEFLVKSDFLIEIALDVWNDLSSIQRSALVDHMLQRCNGVEDEKNGDMKWSIRAPEVQEFPEIAGRYGQYTDALIDMAKNLKNT
jgi:hypothetical protein